MVCRARSCCIAGLIWPCVSSTDEGGEEDEWAIVSGCTLLDCSACKHVSCNQQALHSLQSLLSGATPVGHAKWHTLTDHLPHNSSGLQVQEVRTSKLWGLPLTKQCNSTYVHKHTHTHTCTYTHTTHTHTHTHTHTTHFVLLDLVSQVTGLYSESSPLGAFAIVVSDLPHRPQSPPSCSEGGHEVVQLGNFHGEPRVHQHEGTHEQLTLKHCLKGTLHGVQREFFTTNARNIVDVCAVMQTWLLPAHC